MPDNDYIVDDSVLRDAIAMIEKSARLLRSLENFYFASEADEIRYAKKKNEALANIRAAMARLE